MPRLRVAFDTNVYRSISQSRFEELRRKERSHSIVGIASYWVAAELLSHLASRSDRSFGPALAGLRRLIVHCRTYNGSQYVLPVIGDVDSQIAWMLFGERLFRDNESPYDIADLVGVFAPEQELVHVEEYAEELKYFAREVELAEKRFADNIWKNIIQSSLPSALDWTDLARDRAKREQVLRELGSTEAETITAQVHVDRIVARLRCVISEDERAAKIEEVRRTLLIPIRLQNALFSRIVSEGLDLTRGKHSNTLWDLHIVFCAHSFDQFDRTPFWLVTDDRLILRAASDAGVKNAVRSLEEYEAALQSGTIPNRRPPTFRK